MLPTTAQATKAILQADPTLSATDRNKIIAILRNPEPEAKPEPIPPGKILRRREVAELLSVTPRTVDAWAVQGLLKRVILKGRTRSSGFLLADVMALLGART